MDRKEIEEKLKEVEKEEGKLQVRYTVLAKNQVKFSIDGDLYSSVDFYVSYEDAEEVYKALKTVTSRVTRMVAFGM